jgi:hypothetical protein
MLRVLLLTAIILMGGLVEGSLNPALATSCDEDCVGRCRRCLLGGCITEPACHLQCETEKRAACLIRTPIPHVPSTTDIDPTNPGRTLDALCKIPFENYTHSVIAYCANWPGRSDFLDLIEQAKNILVGAGIFSAGEFAGVDIRWCPLQAADGMAPAQNRILLNPSLRTNIATLAIVLGHEMFHQRQYRNWGSDNFQCRYSRELPKGTGRDNAVEGEAYEFQDRITPVIWNFINRQGTSSLPPAPALTQICSTPFGGCQLPMPIGVGQPCNCLGPSGFIPGMGVQPVPFYR